MKVLFALYVAIWAVILPFQLAKPASQTFQKDAGSYHLGATNLALQNLYSFDGTTPTIEREPGYSFFLSLVYRVFGVGNRTAIFAMQMIIYGLAVWTFLQFWKSKLAAAFLLFSPTVFHTLFSVLRENLTLSLFLFLFALFFAYQQSPSLKKTIGMGLLLAAISITTYPFIFLPIFLIPLFWKRKEHAAILVLLPLVLVSLWGMRNMALDGTFRIVGPFRHDAMIYGRIEQAKTLTMLQPFQCIWSEYIHSIPGLPLACSMSALRHVYSEQNLPAPSSLSLLSHLPNYLWQSAVNGITFVLPYVGGWGHWYNILAAIEAVILFIGCVFARWRLPFVLPLLYTMAVFCLNESIPRFHMPILFVFCAMAALGYERLFSLIKHR